MVVSSTVGNIDVPGMSLKTPIGLTPEVEENA
jgi:hypothetical protein